MGRLWLRCLVEGRVAADQAGRDAGDVTIAGSRRHVMDIIEQMGDLALQTWKIRLWARRWMRYGGSNTLGWQVYRLHRNQRGHIPDEPGIYTLVAKPSIAKHPESSYLMYLGQTESLHRRFGEYLTKEKRETGRPKVFLLLNLYPDHTWFCFTPVPLDDLNAAEDALLEAFLPPCNDQLPATVRKVTGAF